MCLNCKLFEDEVAPLNKHHERLIELIDSNINRTIYPPIKAGRTWVKGIIEWKENVLSDLVKKEE